MPRRIRIDSAAHLLANLPHLLGCVPRESLVLVPIAAQQSCGVLRMDLPGPENIDRVAATAVGTACRVREAEDLVIVVYTDGPVIDGDGVSYDALVAAVAARAEACDVNVTGELCVGSDGWSSYDDPELRPLSELADADDHPADTLATDPTEGTELPRADEDDRELVAQYVLALARLRGDAFTRIRAHSGPGTGIDDVDAELSRFDADPYAFFETSVAESAPPPARAAMWIWILRSPALRDVVIAQWAGDAAEAEHTCRWQEKWTDGMADAPDFPLRLSGEGPRPDMDRLTAVREFVRGLAARAPDPSLAACLAVCGWLCWALGNSTHAAAYAGRARDLDGTYSLSDLILSLTSHGLLPGWAFDRAGAPLIPSWLLAPEPASIT